MTETKIWRGDPPVPQCDICGDKFVGGWIDGKTLQGVWANLCEECYASNGAGLATRFVFAAPKIN